MAAGACELVGGAGVVAVGADMVISVVFCESMIVIFPRAQTGEAGSGNHVSVRAMLGQTPRSLAP